MAAVEEEIRIPQDPHRTEGGVFGKNQPQESTQTDERTGYPGGPRRPRQEILFLQREGRQDGTEHTRKRLPCRCLPPEGGDGRHGIQVRLGQGLFSPVIDFCNDQILAYSVSESPNRKMVLDMLSRLHRKFPRTRNRILHSDQGWQYQRPAYRKRLEEYGIIQSMSRKGNCLDNSKTENLFSKRKKEMFYGQSSRLGN